MVETRRLTREECAAAYDVPPPVVGILDRATFSNITEQHIMLYQDTFGPWLTMIEETPQTQLIDPEPLLAGQGGAPPPHGRRRRARLVACARALGIVISSDSALTRARTEGNMRFHCVVGTLTSADRGEAIRSARGGASAARSRLCP